MSKRNSQTKSRDPRGLAAIDLSLACKLGSIVVHADEMMSADGHAFDRVAIQQLISDPEVSAWIGEMQKQAMVPVKRRKP